MEKKKYNQFSVWSFYFGQLRGMFEKSSFFFNWIRICIAWIASKWNEKIEKLFGIKNSLELGGKDRQNIARLVVHVCRVCTDKGMTNVTLTNVILLVFSDDEGCFQIFVLTPKAKAVILRVKTNIRKQKSRILYMPVMTPYELYEACKGVFSTEIEMGGHTVRDAFWWFKKRPGCLTAVAEGLIFRPVRSKRDLRFNGAVCNNLPGTLVYFSTRDADAAGKSARSTNQPSRFKDMAVWFFSLFSDTFCTYLTKSSSQNRLFFSQTKDITMVIQTNSPVVVTDLKKIQVPRWAKSDG